MTKATAFCSKCGNKVNWSFTKTVPFNVKNRSYQYNAETEKIELLSYGSGSIGEIRGKNCESVRMVLSPNGDAPVHIGAVVICPICKKVIPAAYNIEQQWREFLSGQERT